ncbi:rod shape-determining protein MreC [alpha proteobacterium HIMB5]|nr:rod shape-determining protein MreC [alpha proteobacterium HIMB5]
MSVSRDDFVIAIRSAFLKKQTKQRFSLLSLIFLSIFILFLSNQNFKIISFIKSTINEVIYRGSFVISAPEKALSSISEEFDHIIKVNTKVMILEDELADFKSKDVSLKILEFENQKLREQLDDYLVSSEIIYSKIIIDNNSPYLKSFVINKGSRDGVKVGMVVLDQNYLVGKIIEVNFNTSRVLLLSDINSNIPISISPGNLQAIATGTSDDFAKVNYLKKIHLNKISNDSIVYTSGTGGLIKSGIPIGKIIDFDQTTDEVKIQFFSDFSQLQYVSVASFDKVEKQNEDEISKTDNSWKEGILFKGPSPVQLNERLEALVQEKEINDQIRSQIEAENLKLKDQLSQIQKKLFQSEKKINEQSKVINSHKIDKEEYNFLKLNLEFGPKCAKKTIISKGFKVGSPEYRKCVLRRGIKTND